MDERRASVPHEILARMLQGSMSLEGIVFLVGIICGLIGLSFLFTLLCVIAILLIHLLTAWQSAQDLIHSKPITTIVRHLEAHPDDLRNFLVQHKAPHLALKLRHEKGGSRTDEMRWLNSLIAKLWPMGEVEVVEILDQLGLSRKGQGIRVGDFKVFIDRFTLGKRPPVITHISVGDKEETRIDEVIIDLHVAYFGDCNISFAHPIGIRNLRAGIRDIKFDGDARISLRPLLADLPLVGGFVFCFLKTPLIDFEGISLMNVIDNRLVKNAMETIVTGLMVRPNKLYYTMTKKDTLQRRVILPEPMGLVYLDIIRGRSLKARRCTLSGKPTVDPILLIRIGETFFRSEIKKDDCNPVWLFARSSPFNDLMETVSIQVFDHNTRDRRDILGEAKLPVHRFLQEDDLNGKKMWIKIDKDSMSSLELRMACLSVEASGSNLKQSLELLKSLPKGFPLAVLSVYVHSVQTYPGIEANGKVAPFILVKHGKHSHATTTFSVQKSGNNLIHKVNDGCYFMLTDDPRKELLQIVALDSKKTSPSSAVSSQFVCARDQILGSRSLDLSGIVESEKTCKEVKFSLYRGNVPLLKISMFVAIAAAQVSPSLVHNLDSDTVRIWGN